MTKKDDGGPAFPGEQSETQDGAWNPTFEQGMSIRDVFAKEAMRVLAYDWQKEVAEGIYNNFAQDCYLLADAMIKERAK